MSKRQFWRVRNVSNRVITLSDLPRVPTFAPNQVHDLFRYYSIVDIEQSQNLLTLMNRGTFEMVKQKDSSNRFIKSVTSARALANAEEDEIDLSISENNVDFYTRDEVYTKDEVDAIVESIGGNYDTVVVTDNYAASTERVILVNALSKDITITLPEATSSEHITYYIKKIDSSGHSVIIDGYDNDTIDENLTVSITIQYMCLKVMCDSVEWWII